MPASSTSSTPATPLPVRAGVFATVEAAKAAVHALLAAGFAHEQIIVVCSDEQRAEHFRDVGREPPAGKHSPAAAAAGGTVGAAVAGGAALAAGAATGSPGMLAASGLAVWTGAIVGGLVGAMMTRGVAKEVANYYDQSVAKGMILVSVEEHGPDPEGRLALAERILADCGAQPRPLPEG